MLLFEDLDTVARKVRRAVTDSDNEVRYDFVAKPGVSNLLGILAAATDRKLAINGNVTTTAGSTLSFTITSESAYDQLSIGAGKSINLTNANLDVTLADTTWTWLPAGGGATFLADPAGVSGRLNKSKPLRESWQLIRHCSRIFPKPKAKPSSDWSRRESAYRRSRGYWRISIRS